MDREQAEVIQLLADVFVKVVLSLAAAGIFIAFAVTLIVNPSWLIASVEAFLTGTIYVVFKHYFPAKR